MCNTTRVVLLHGNSTLLKSAKYLKKYTHIHDARSGTGMEVSEQTDIGRRKFIPWGKGWSYKSNVKRKKSKVGEKAGWIAKECVRCYAAKA